MLSLLKLTLGGNFAAFSGRMVQWGGQFTEGLGGSAYHALLPPVSSFSKRRTKA